MAASTQLARQWGIFQTLHRRQAGMTAAQLAKQFGVSKNTVVRDLDTLSAAGFTVEQTEQGNRHVFRLSDGIRQLGQIQLTELELLALYAARNQLAPLAGTPIFADLMSLQHKIRGMVQPGTKGHLEKMSGVFMEHPRGLKSYRAHQETIDDVVNAILNCKVCVIEYTKLFDEDARSHELRPLKLFFNNGGLYLIGLLGRRRFVSTLAVERIRGIEVTRKAFKRPRGLDIEGRYESLFGVFEEGEPQLVEVIFSEDAAPFIKERVWHPDQVIEDLPDGRVRWRARVQGKYEVMAWVMSRADQAELVKPAAWRRELRGRLVSSVDLYGGGVR